jgi:phospholipid/cholesterol/gamma-HCH transport system substrate-binding protein
MATPELRRDFRSVLAGLIVLAVIGLIVYVSAEAQTGWPLAKTTTVKAEIDDVHTLAVNDQVRQNSKRIGRVSAIDYHDGKALVTMELEGKREVYRDAHAEVWDASALAMKFVEFNPGTSTSGDLGNEAIPATHTKGSADLQQLLSVFDPKTRTLATRTVREVGGGVAGHSEDFHHFVGSSPDLLNDLATTSDALASDEADLAGLLHSSDQLAARFRGREELISSLVKQSDTTLRAFAVDDGRPLEATLRKSPVTLQKARAALGSLDAPLANLQQAMTTVKPGADALGRSTADIRGLLRDGVPVLDNVPGVAHQAEPVVQDLTETFKDARPLAPRLAAMFSDLATPLSVLAPYGPEIAQLFVRGHSFVSEGPTAGVRYARLSFNTDLTAVTGGLFASDHYPRNEYPAPGEATGDRATGGLPSGLIPTGGNR